jgi:hypothetical protein
LTLLKLTRCRSPEETMARSLTVKHEEKVGTSPLLNAFLLLALAWMVGGAVLSSAGETPLTGTATASEK